MKIQYTLSLMAAAAVVLIASGPLQASVTDDRIESSAKESFVFRTFLKNDEVEIKSKEGVVVLTGTVSEESHKSLAENTVDVLPGVKSVENRLKIEGSISEKGSDAWLTTKVKTALLFHRNVSGIQTKVSSKDGVVTLEGEADTTLEKDLTSEYAKDIEGVKSVENKMSVAKRSKKSGETMVENIDDASITSLVKMTLLVNRSTDANNTQVETNQGIVKLGGKAQSEAQKDLTGKLVADVHGVKRVLNNMTVSESMSENN